MAREGLEGKSENDGAGKRDRADEEGERKAMTVQEGVETEEHHTGGRDHNDMQEIGCDEKNEAARKEEVAGAVSEGLLLM